MCILGNGHIKVNYWWHKSCLVPLQQQKHQDFQHDGNTVQDGSTQISCFCLLKLFLPSELWLKCLVYVMFYWLSLFPLDFFIDTPTFPPQLRVKTWFFFLPKHCCLHWGFVTSTISTKTSGLKRKFPPAPWRHSLCHTHKKWKKLCERRKNSWRSVSLGIIVNQKQTHVASGSSHHGLCGPSIALCPSFFPFLPSLLTSASPPHTLSRSAAHYFNPPECGPAPLHASRKTTRFVPPGPHPGPRAASACSLGRSRCCGQTDASREELGGSSFHEFLNCSMINYCDMRNCTSDSVRQRNTDLSLCLFAISAFSGGWHTSITLWASRRHSPRSPNPAIRSDRERLIVSHVKSLTSSMEGLAGNWERPL